MPVRVRMRTKTSGDEDAPKAAPLGLHDGSIQLGRSADRQLAAWSCPEYCGSTRRGPRSEPFDDSQCARSPVLVPGLGQGSSGDYEQQWRPRAAVETTSICGGSSETGMGCERHVKQTRRAHPQARAAKACPMQLACRLRRSDPRRVKEPGARGASGLVPAERRTKSLTNRTLAANAMLH
ncbi:hypothetical protein PSPO01_10270 [Paraphaeosphaeria sporulosa]